MHSASLKLMQTLVERHVPKERRIGTVVDIGSYDHNGTYRPLMESLGTWQYVGVDLFPGPNVDIVVPERGDWIDLVPQADTVISGQCLEHTRWPWVWIRQLACILRPGGTMILIAPYQHKPHPYPVDCWRILPDGMQSLFEWAGLEFIAADIVRYDCWGVGHRR